MFTECCNIYVLTEYCNIYGFTECCNIYVLTKCCNICVFTECCNIYVFTECCNIYVLTECCNIFVLTECCNIYGFTGSFAKDCSYRVAKMHRMKLQVSFRKRATNYRPLLRKMTYNDKASYRSSPLCVYCCLTCTLHIIGFMISTHTYMLPDS